MANPNAAELLELRAHFATIGKQPAMARLQRVADKDADGDSDPTAAEAAEWLGDLWRRESPSQALLYYARAYRLPATPLVHALAARGLGDLSFADQRYRLAGAYFAEAAVGASPGSVLEAELFQKRRICRTFFVRRVIEWICWAWLVGVSLVFLGRARRQRRSLAPPPELYYVLPVYLFLVAGAWGRDANVLRALGLCAAGSLLLIFAAGCGAARIRRLRHVLLDALLLVTANGALFFAVLNRMELIDNLVFTVQL